MKWFDDPLCVKMPRRRAVLQLAMYAQHLATGNSLLMKQLKVATVKQYVRAAASLFAVGTIDATLDRRDYRKDEQGDSKFSPLLQAIYDELERWEKQPNRREPFTIEMLEYLATLVKTSSASSLSLHAALLDWFEIGLFAGLRLTEWAQTNAHRNVDSPQLDDFGDARAFCLNDVRAVTRTGIRLQGAAILRFPLDQILQCWIRWRTQKNSQNGEEKTYTRNPRVGGREFIRPMYRILQRFVALRGADDITTPLALYSETSHIDPLKVRFVTSSDIDTVMRAVAAAVYKMDPEKDFEALQRWSSHSLRVGACVILHALGFTAEQIQFLLRWRSKSFMDYLRNIAVLANRQTQAVDTMPHFLP
jgi:hypothetical protein